MAEKTLITISGKSYLAELVDEEIPNKNGVEKGFRFRIKDEQGHDLGCIATFIALFARRNWNRYVEVTPELKKRIFLRILPYVSLDASIEELSKRYPDYMQLFLDASESRYEKEDFSQIINAYASPKELVRELIFKGAFEDDIVEKDILTYLFKQHKENRYEKTIVDNMIKELFIDEDVVMRCLGYLSDDGYIKGEGAPDFAVVVITTSGARYVKNNFEKVSAGKEVLYVMGDYVGKDKISTSIQGRNVQNIVNSTVSNSFNIELVEHKIEELKQVIEKDYTGNDKRQVLAQVEEVKSLSAEKENFPIIRKKLGVILSKTAEIATVVSVVVQLIQFFT